MIIELVLMMTPAALFEADAKAFEIVEQCVRSNVRIYGQVSEDFESVWLASKSKCRAEAEAAKLQMMLNEMDFNETKSPDVPKLLKDIPRHWDELWDATKEKAASDFLELRLG